MKFYLQELTEIQPDKLMSVLYRHKKYKPTLEERLPETECPTCGMDEWIVLDKKHPLVVQSGKLYIECLHCGYFNHL